MNRISKSAAVSNGQARVVTLHLELRDQRLVDFFEPLEEPERSSKAMEALRFGVMMLQAAPPALDAAIVKGELAEIENRFSEHSEAFQKEIGVTLQKYFNGDNGALVQFLQRYFDPKDGRIARLMQDQIGPASRFGKLFDPDNKMSILALIEEKVRQLVEEKLNTVLGEFSLDQDDSAMSRLKGMIEERFTGLSQALGIKAARATEAERGHVKGFDFETCVYEVLAGLASQLGDEPTNVRGTPGLQKRKTGDHVVTLGEITGAPGLKIVFEMKDQQMKAKDAIAELQEAKKNRGAVNGIFVFSKGCEPVEFGNFKRIENDFFCTVDKEALAANGPLPFFWGAYEIARAQAVAAARKDANGKLDLERIQKNIDGLVVWVPRLADIMTKANTVQNNGKAIESTARDIKDDLEKRTKDIFEVLRLDPAD